jgi:hypothetical protein
MAYCRDTASDTMIEMHQVPAEGPRTSANPKYLFFSNHIP